MEGKPTGKPTAAVICHREKSRQIIKSAIEKIVDVYVFESIEDDKIKNVNIKPAIIFIQFDNTNMEATKESLAFAQKKYPRAIIIIIVHLKKQSDIMKALKMAKAFVYVNAPLKSDYIFQAAVISLDYYQRTLQIVQLKKSAQIKIKQQQSVIEKYKEREVLFKEKISKIKGKAIKIQEKEKDYVEKIEYFDEKLEIRTKLSEQLSTRNDELELQVIQLESFPSQVILTLNKFNRELEYYYFTDHYQYVREIAIALGKGADFSGQEIKILQMAVIMHNVYAKQLHIMLKLSNPFDLEDDLRSIYFKAFNKAIAILGKIDSIKPYVSICKQIWEHNDGTGYPLGLYEDDISKIAQVIAVANQYHNKVYSVFPTKLAELEAKGMLIQLPGETANRHKDAVKYFSKHQRWYNYDIMRVFQELAKHKENRFLVPKSQEMKIEYNAVKIDLHEDSRKITNIDDILLTKTKFNYNIAANREEKIYEQRKVPILQIKQGMKTINALITVNGVNAINENKVIDADDLKKILQLFQADVIGDSIDLMVSIYN